MKRKFKTVVTLVLVLLIIGIFPSAVFAYEYGELDVESMIVTKEVGETTKKSISREDINRIRISKSRSMKNKSGQERLYDILTKIDSNMADKEKEIVCSNLDLNDVEGICISEVFLEINENGNEKIVNEEYALQNSAVINKAQQNEIFPSTEWHHSDPETFVGGDLGGLLPGIAYMQQQLTTIYTPLYGDVNTPGRYVIFGSSTWLTQPINRKTDCITLSSPDFVFSSTNKDDFLGYLIYNVELEESGKPITSYEDAKEIEKHNITVSRDKGAYSTFNLPNDKNNAISNIRIKNISTFVMGVANINKIPTTNWVGVDLVYSHTKAIIDSSIDFGWKEEGGIAFGVSLSFGTDSKEYIHTLGWDFKADYNKYF